jgi:hypothetical protein
MQAHSESMVWRHAQRGNKAHEEAVYMQRQADIKCAGAIARQRPRAFIAALSVSHRVMATLLSLSLPWPPSCSPRPRSSRMAVQQQPQPQEQLQQQPPQQKPASAAAAVLPPTPQRPHSRQPSGGTAPSAPSATGRQHLSPRPKMSSHRVIVSRSSLSVSDAEQEPEACSSDSPCSSPRRRTADSGAAGPSEDGAIGAPPGGWTGGWGPLVDDGHTSRPTSAGDARVVLPALPGASGGAGSGMLFSNQVRSGHHTWLIRLHAWRPPARCMPALAGLTTRC